MPNINFSGKAQQDIQKHQTGYFFFKPSILHVSNLSETKKWNWQFFNLNN